MIIPTKKRLTIIFTSVILIFNAFILLISFIFLHQSIMSGAKRQMKQHITNKFVDQYRRTGLDLIGSMWDEYYFQILNKEGAVIVSARNSAKFYPEAERGLIDRAFAGKESLSILKIRDNNHLVAYFPLDGKYIGRAAMALTDIQVYEENFRYLIILTLPGMFLLSYMTSRFLVNHAMEKISDFFTFQETFSSNVTHELRSPLASLKGNLEVSLRKERPVEEYKEVLALSLKEVDRIIVLLKNLYLLASSKFKPLDLIKKDADIVKLVNDITESYRTVIASRGIRLTLTETSGAVCRCDEALIRRTIENLFDNAMKYTPDNGSISLTVQKDQRNISLTIINTCQPLDSEEMKHIFDPFYRGRNTRKTNAEGKGLGLYISRYIARSHGGDIRINNTYGNLFSLTFTVPVRR